MTQSYRKKAVWIERFVDRLRQLKPEVSLVDAIDIAVVEFPKACDRSPEEAAVFYAVA